MSGGISSTQSGSNVYRPTTSGGSIQRPSSGTASAERTPTSGGADAGEKAPGMTRDGFGGNAGSQKVKESGLELGGKEGQEGKAFDKDKKGTEKMDKESGKDDLDNEKMSDEDFDKMMDEKSDTKSYYDKFLDKEVGTNSGKFDANAYKQKLAERIAA